MRVAWFTPLSNEADFHRRGSATVSEYATRMLLPKLEGEIEIDIYTDSERVENTAAYFGLPQNIYHYLSAFQRLKEKPYDIFFYQIEDSPLSSFIRSHVGLIPGVVWLHDLLFQNLSAEALSISPWENTLYEFAGIKPLVPELPGPVGYREAYLSAIPIFSNPWAHSEFRRLCYETIPERYGVFPSSFHLPLPVNCVDRKADSGTFQIAFGGSTFIEDRAHKILASLSSVKSPYEFIWMIEATGKVRAEELCTEFGIQNVQFIVGRSPEQWEKIVSRSNVAIHTHYSVYGNADPYLSISIGAGVPALVSDFGTTGYYPEDCVIPITPGASETSQISQAINLLATNSQSTSGRTFIEDERDAVTVAQELKELLTTTGPMIKKVLADWDGFQTATKKILIEKLRSKNRDVSPLTRSYNDLGWDAA